MKKQPGLPVQDQRQKTAIYIRVSTQMQIDKDSLDVQRRELTVYSDMVLGIHDFEVFEDPGFSAKNTDRPKYQEMMSRIRSGEFSHLLVWKIDRISRNLLDFSSMYAELKSLGVTFVSKNEQFDTSTAIGEAMLKIILVFAELERKMTAERVTAVMLSRANNGQWNGGRVPYAYRYEKETKTFSIDKTQQSIYELIVTLYERNQSLVSVAKYLNKKQIATSSGKEWTPTSLHRILTNPWYVGDYRYNVHSASSDYAINDKCEWITIENHHEPLIDRLHFERIQAMLKRNTRGGVPIGKTYERKNIHIFAGVLKCGECGSIMTATLDRTRVSGWRPSAYGCSVRRRKSDRCKSKYISDVTLGPFVFNFIANVIRARGRIGERTTIKQLQRILLAGEAFASVKSIDDESLEQLRVLLLSGETGIEYHPHAPLTSETVVEANLKNLRERKQRYETALGRLKSLYLYADSGLSEENYTIERQKLESDLEATERRLEDLSASATQNQEELIEQASYFIMAEKLNGDDYIDYQKYLSKIDPKIPKAFIKRVVKEITIVNGEVESIEFINGIKCIFTR